MRIFGNHLSTGFMFDPPDSTAATRPVYDKWAATIGKDLVKKAETAIATAK